MEAKPADDVNQLLLYRLDGSVTHLQDRIVGWDVVRDQIHASADDNSITAHDHTGARLWTRPAHRAAGTVIPVGDDLALGYPDGEVEVIPRSEQSQQQSSKLRDTASANVYTMRPGPAGIVVAGYSNGFVGVWLARTGELLRTHAAGMGGGARDLEGWSRRARAPAQGPPVLAEVIGV